MRAFPERCVLFICVVSAVFLFTHFWSSFRHIKPIFKHYEREETVHNSTRNTTCCVVQSKPSTATCTTVNFYELYKRSSQVNNVTLYVTPFNIWKGRLGNQMFKYASTLGLARAQGRQMFISSNTSLEKIFKITHVANKSAQLWPYLREGDPFDASLMNLPFQNVRIRGYVQSFWYFAAVMDEVRQEFTFHDSIANDAATIFHNVHLTYNASMIVGVHVRRGDFLKEKNQHLGYGVAENSYFRKAFRLMKSKFPGREMIFLVASDDLRWCSQNLMGVDVYILPPASAAVHLAVLSKCDHMIISGGTYGWWSGWLANGYVIYYTGHMDKGTPLGMKFERHQYYPRMWIGLGN